jgi:hypothetical protein
MQGGWAQRRRQDLHAGGGGVGRRSRGDGRLISATHGVADKHADNCINASTSASTKSVKNASASSAIFEKNDNGIHSTRAKASAATTITKARRRPAASPVTGTKMWSRQRQRRDDDSDDNDYNDGKAGILDG